jgi:hypothetical protein
LIEAQETDVLIGDRRSDPLGLKAGGALLEVVTIGLRNII